jgi:hypothetical protein
MGEQKRILQEPWQISMVCEQGEKVTREDAFGRYGTAENILAVANAICWGHGITKPIVIRVDDQLKEALSHEVGKYTGNNLEDVEFFIVPATTMNELFAQTP